jgi:hypothetical protein
LQGAAQSANKKIKGNAAATQAPTLNIAENVTQLIGE